MNYKYIEQLLERYWECQTTIEEEAILRAFFSQNDVPARLLPYRDLFLVEEEMAADCLGDDFDHRLMERLERESVNERPAVSMPSLTPITFSHRLAPLFRAAASVAVIVTIAMAAQQGFRHDDEDVESVPQYAQEGERGDTLMLFVDMPEPADKVEAIVSSPPIDTLFPRFQ